MLCIDGSCGRLHMGAYTLFMFIIIKVCLWTMSRTKIIASQLDAGKEGLICALRLLVSRVHSQCCLPNICIIYKHFPNTTSIVIMKERQSAEQSSASWNMKACLLTNSLQGSRLRSLWVTQPAGLDRGSEAVDCVWHQLNGEEERVDNETYL